MLVRGLEHTVKEKKHEKEINTQLIPSRVQCPNEIGRFLPVPAFGFLHFRGFIL